jgi:membrane-bound lytic murein transglycosylase A
MTLKYLLLILIVLSSSCARQLLISRNDSMKVDQDFLIIVDDLPIDKFQEGVSKNIKLLMRRPDSTLQFGPLKISTRDYAWALDKLTKFKEKDQLLSFINKNFIAMKVYGKNKWGEILLTSYYEPLYGASKIATLKYSQPIYKIPSDLVQLDLKKLSNKKLGALSSNRKVTGGMLVPGLGHVPRVIPFYNRKEIDIDHKLKGKNLELYYLDPINAFFLQVQGSGILQLKDGSKVRIGYAAQNGWKYESLGKHLFDIIPKEEMSLQRIDAYLRTLEKKKLFEMLAINPSYVFFRVLEGRGLTTFGNEVIAGRTLAVDSSYIPLGSLGYLTFKRPYYAKETSDVPTSFNQTSRLIIAQDTGGAIKSTGRADLYWGEGDEALKYAGTMRHSAKLWFLIPKKSFIPKSQIPFD